MPDVRKFVLGRGNADSFIGLKINFVPHHHPYLIVYDEAGNEPPEEEWKDLQNHKTEALYDLFLSLGFVRKELL